MTNDRPNIATHFLVGTTLFSTATFAGAGSYALYRGYHNVFRYSFLTAFNVGVAGGLFTGISKFPFFQKSSHILDANRFWIGIRASLLHLPNKEELTYQDYLFASGISAGFVGGTFNLINSRPIPILPIALAFHKLRIE